MRFRQLAKEVFTYGESDIEKRSKAAGFALAFAAYALLEDSASEIGVDGAAKNLVDGLAQI